MRWLTKIAVVSLIGVLLFGSLSVCLAAKEQKSAKNKAAKAQVIPAAKRILTPVKWGT